LWSTKPPARPPGPTVVVALAPTHAADTRVAELEPLRAYLERVVDRQVEFIVPPTYGETARLLLQGEVPYASLPPYTYIEARAMDPDVQPLAIHVIDHSHGVDGLLLVREDSPATGVASLRGARICYVDERSTSGYQLPRIALRRAGLDPDVDLAEAVFSGSHDEVLRDVIAGHCDVAATYSDAWNTASNKGIPIGTTRILATTGRSPHDVFCAGPDVEPLLTGRLQRALLTFDPVAETGQERLGSNELLTGFREGEDDDYDDLREVVAADQAAREDH